MAHVCLQLPQQTKPPKGARSAAAQAASQATIPNKSLNSMHHFITYMSLACMLFLHLQVPKQTARGQRRQSSANIRTTQCTVLLTCRLHIITLHLRLQLPKQTKPPQGARSAAAAAAAAQPTASCKSRFTLHVILLHLHMQAPKHQKPATTRAKAPAASGSER
jgi:hypothetical protein